jgi:hypothetical protein
MSQTQQPTTLPRRANTIRQLSAAMAHKKLTEDGQRQAASDKIGYAVAVLLGAVAFMYGGKLAVVGLIVVYLLNAVRAYQRWKALTK